MTEPKRILVTAALPYANGSLHLGHLVEYCQADIYVRALKRLGKNALYICANDAHGTPIEVNATRLKVTPEQLIGSIHTEHQQDFAKFDVAFDYFGTTHESINERVVQQAYQQLQAQNMLTEREIDGNYCPQDLRFLPDRYIKGICPRCGAQDQYGDVCESCGATYAPTDLKAAKCVLCGATPQIRKSNHVFFKLSQCAPFLQQWIDQGALQADVANYVRGWIDGGLRDWCISRDGPYFGFAIPGKSDKYFYVWLDAPLGYVAASYAWAKQNNVSEDALWRSDETRIEHIIGKDIVYFHTLFWPAVLQSLSMTLPAKVHVHGMLTVNGEKMSKSRGTFIKAAHFANHVDPQALRYYYACKYSSQSDDLDLSFDDFLQRINTELVNKHVNLFSRVGQMLNQKLAGMLSDLPFAAAEAQERGSSQPMLAAAQLVVQHARQIERLYVEREFSQVIRCLCAIADIGNEWMQAHKPWDELKQDPEKARLTLSFAANICHALAMYLWPIVPRLAQKAAEVLASNIDTMDATKLFCERKRRIGAFERLFERLEMKSIDAMLEGKPTVDTPSTQPQVTPLSEPLRPDISYDTFSQLDLRVGKVIEASFVPKSKKLLKLQVDLGLTQPRQIIAGLALAYQPEQLIGKKIVVVANLQAAKLMGLDSCGMVLAAGEPPALQVLLVGDDLPVGAPVR